MRHFLHLRKIFAVILVFLMIPGMLTSIVPANAAIEGPYRWRNDNGNDIDASFIAGQNTSIDVSLNDPKRLRFDVTGSEEDGALVRGSQINLGDQIVESSLFGASILHISAGFAYFATVTSPAQIIKVQLSNFTAVGSALILSSGEDNVRAAVIDAAAGFAYFATGTSPAKIVKVNLATFTRVAAITLDAGENDIRSAVIDAAAGFAYFGTNTNPGIVVKVNLATFARVDALTLNAGENVLSSAAIESDGDTAYFGTSTSPGIVVNVNLTTFTRTGALTLNAGENTLTSVVIEADDDFVYFGTSTSPGKVIKVQLSDFTRSAVLTFNAGENTLLSAVIDATNSFAYFGTSTAAGKVIKVQLSDFTRSAVLSFIPGENILTTAVIDTTAGFAYFGTSTTPGRVVKVQLSDFTRSLSMTLNGVDVLKFTSDFAQDGTFLYMIALTSPGMIIKYSTISLTPVAVMSLDIGEDLSNTMLLDSAAGFGYVSLDNQISGASKIIKFNLATFTRVGVITLNVNEDRVLSGAIDTMNGFAYYGVSGASVAVVKINLATFTRVGALPTGGTDTFVMMQRDSVQNGFVYAIAGDAVSDRVIKIDLATFTLVGSVDLNAAGITSIVDRTRNVLYASTYTDFVSPGVIKKIDLASFEVVDTLESPDGEVLPFSLALDAVHNFLYVTNLSDDFGLSFINKIDLDTFTNVDDSIAPVGIFDYLNLSPDGTTGVMYGTQYDGTENYLTVTQIFDSREFRLEYGVKLSTCAAIASWTQVPAVATGETWQMSPSTNIANDSVTIDAPGLVNAASSFVVGRSMDTTSQTSSIVLSRITEFTEVEYSITPTSNAETGHYCFRLTDAGSVADFTFATFAEASVGLGGSSVCVPFITIVSPNGGEEYSLGDTRTLIWNFSGCRGVDVRLTLSTDGGLTFLHVVADSVFASQNFYHVTFDATYPTGDSLVLRAALLDATGAEIASDVSDAVFSIQPSLSVPASNGSGPGGTPLPDLTGRTGVFSPVVMLIATPTIAVDKGLVATSASLGCPSGSLIKLVNDHNAKTEVDAAVYYCGIDGKRYVFPNARTFKSWYPNFSSVQEVSPEIMASLPLGGNVTVRPGVRMVKVRTDPKVYAVARDGVLRLIPNEESARLLYGLNWASFIDDVPDVFFSDYTFGDPILPAVVSPASYIEILKFIPLFLRAR